MQKSAWMDKVLRTTVGPLLPRYHQREVPSSLCSPSRGRNTERRACVSSHASAMGEQAAAAAGGASGDGQGSGKATPTGLRSLTPAEVTSISGAVSGFTATLSKQPIQRLKWIRQARAAHRSRTRAHGACSSSRPQTHPNPVLSPSRTIAHIAPMQQQLSHLPPHTALHEQDDWGRPLPSHLPFTRRLIRASLCRTRPCFVNPSRRAASSHYSAAQAPPSAGDAMGRHVASPNAPTLTRFQTDAHTLARSPNHTHAMRPRSSPALICSLTSTCVHGRTSYARERCQDSNNLLYALQP